MENQDINEEQWDEMIAGLREGNAEICSDFWRDYGPLLEGVAQKQISQRLQRRVGPDDIVQSACRTFFRRISDGQFNLPDADALWRLMCAITLTKARRAARDQSRQKRGFQREQYIDTTSESAGNRRVELGSNQSTPFEAAEVADQLQAVLAGLGPEECQVLDLKLQQFTNDEIAEKIGYSERTVRRLMKKIQDRWNQTIDE